jgi:CheY-like chemotaxis protein
VLLVASFRNQLDRRPEWLLSGSHSYDGGATRGDAALSPAEAGDGRSFDGFGCRKDGSLFPIRLSASKSQSSAGPRYTVVIRDLTRQRRLEEELGHAQKLHVIGRLTGRIAHDFNNILMGVGGCVDVAKSKLDPSHPGYRFVEEAKRALGNGAAITRQLMTLGRRPNSGMVCVELDGSIERNRDVLRRLLNVNIELRIIAGAPGVRVNCPEGAVEKILLHAAASAVDGMTQGGRLFIESHVVRLPAEPLSSTLRTRPSGYVTLRIHCTGSAAKQGAESPEPSRAVSLPSLGKGIGLSLAAVHAIVMQSDGHLEVLSDQGAGTMLMIYLPIAASSFDGVASTAPPPSSVMGAAMVLLVEADVMSRLRHRQVLEELGYKVLEADDARTALELGRRSAQRIDALVVDMPLVTGCGFSLAEEVTARNPEVGVIHMSAEPVEQLLFDGVSQLVPGTVVLRKPFDELALQTALQMLLGGPEPAKIG